MAFLKVALLAAPIMICGCPVLGIKMMVGSDCIPITADNSFLFVCIYFVNCNLIFVFFGQTF